MNKNAKALLCIVFSCSSCGQSVHTKNMTAESELQKINITRSQVFDLSGYSVSGGGNPFNLFDENSVVDPRHEITGDAFIPVTNCQPSIHPAIYFHGKTGSRIVIDLKIQYRIREIYFYDRSVTPDSCWIYTGNLKKWKKISSFLSVARSGEWGWKKITVDEESRFVMIRFSSYETVITEMVLYGIPLQPIPPADDFSLHKGFTKTTLNQFLGVNYIMETEPRWPKPFYYSRLYNFALDFDNDTGKNEKRVRYNMLHYGYYNKEKGQYIFDIDNLQHSNHGNIWFSIRGVSKWMNDLGYSDKDRPMNRPDMNSEDPSSYSRHAEMMWHIAAFFGNNKVDTNLLSLSHEPVQSGRGLMSIFENGNEEDANWVGNKYCSPYEYFTQSSADWDGDEGRLKGRYGIHKADPGSRLMMSGLTDLDTNRVKTYRFLSENLRDDKNFIWQGGIQYHYYAQRNGKGISPEDDSLRWRLSRVADCSYRIAPGVKCFLGENGYDKSPGSKQATPLIPGLSASQSQGIMLLRSINAAFFSGFDAYILYWLRDSNPEDDPNTYLTSGILRTMPDGKTKAYPGWYYISTLVNRIGKYRPDRIIRETGDVWIYRYRHSEQQDSVAYFIYKPNVNGSRAESFVIEAVKTSSTVSKIIFTDDSEFGKEELVPVSDGKLKLTV
ncbi:MAG TPA: hypothetical protein VIL90_01425, partial [Puia sp.]